MKTNFSGLIWAIILGLISVCSAQTYQFTTKTFDLEKDGLHQGWKNFGGYVNNEGNFVIRLGRPFCDAKITERTEFLNTVSFKAEFKGVAYDFKEIIFNNDLDYQKAKDLRLETTFDAIKYQRNLFGTSFLPPNSKVMKNSNNPYAAIGASFDGAFTMPELTADYIGEVIVIPKQKMSIGKPNIKVSNFAIHTLLKGNINVRDGIYPSATTSCREFPVFTEMKEIDTRSEKDQIWQIASNSVYPGGGIVAFYTKNVNPDESKLHVIIKNYNADLEEKKVLDIGFDYFPHIQSLVVHNQNNNHDLLLLCQQTDNVKDPHLKKFAKSPAVADFAELIYIDGNSFEVKHKQTITLPYSKWYKVQMKTTDAGDVYLMGKCAKDNKTPHTYIDWGDKGLDNFQILKYSGGKMIWIKGYDRKKDANKLKIVKGENVKGNTEKEVIIETPSEASKFTVHNGRLFINNQLYQNMLYLAIFDDKTGDLLQYFVKPESIEAKSDVILTKDGNTVYWATYDFKKYNDYDSKTNVITADKIKSMIAGELFISKIDLVSGNAQDFKLLGDKEWVVSYRDPLILRDAASDYFVFQGRTLAKKAKDSELILVKVYK